MCNFLLLLFALNHNALRVKIINAQDCIDNEGNKLRRKIMKFNFDYTGSPYNISASTMNINHSSLLEILNENLIKNKHIA